MPIAHIQILRRLERHVADCRVVLVMGETDLELGLHFRLIEARESEARVGGLELSHCQPSATQRR